jgi:AraC-like DNA-binding protein
MEKLELALWGTRLAEFIVALEREPRLLVFWDSVGRRYSDRDFRLDDYGRECGMSKNNLNRALKRLTGFTAMKVVTAYRLYHALSDGVRSNRTWMEIAESHGFESQQSFTRTMNTWLNASPSQLLPKDETLQRHWNLPEQNAQNAKKKGKRQRSALSG